MTFEFCLWPSSQGPGSGEQQYIDRVEKLAFEAVGLQQAVSISWFDPIFTTRTPKEQGVHYHMAARASGHERLSCWSVAIPTDETFDVYVPLAFSQT